MPRSMASGAALAEPDRLLLTRQHLESTVVSKPGHDKVHRVGSNIDGRFDRRRRWILHDVQTSAA
jgi:hypothetical protein